MGPILLLLFIGIPILEIAVFIRVGDLIGLWPTIGTVLFTAMVGTALLRQQGLATLAKARSTLNTGTLPVKELFDGACLLVGGVLLLTPGFITDIMGLALLIPPVREVLRRLLSTRVKTQVHGGGDPGIRDPGIRDPGIRDPGIRDGGGTAAGRGPNMSSSGPTTPWGQTSARPDVIDGDFVDITPEKTPPPSDGGSSPSGRNPRDSSASDS